MKKEEIIVKGYNKIREVCWKKFSEDEYKIKDIWFMGYNYLWRVELIRKIR